MLCFGTKKEEEEGEGDGVEEEDRRHLRRRRRRSMPKSEGDEPNNGREWAWTNGGTVTKRKKLKKRRKSKTKHHNSDMDTEQKQLAQNGQREMEKRMPNGNNGREKCSSSGPLIGTAEGGIEFAKITDRIFALLYPSGSDNLYRQNIKLVSDRIKRIFQDRYKIFNLSQKRSDLGRANSQGAVVELGWPDTLAPPLDRLCSICKQIENYLSAGAENVTIIHCKGGLYRAGIVVAAFMHYSSISERDANVADRFSMKLFTEKFLGYDAQPSHKRYVSYFANLLSGSVKVYPSPIFLSQLSLSRIFPGRLVTLKLYERMKPIWSSGKIFLGENSAVGLPDGALSLRGDVLLKCCVPSSDGLEKQLLFQCQFNTCALNLDALDNPKLNLYKEELDYLFDGQLVDSSASLELAFELVDPQPPLNNNNNNSVTAKQPQQRKSASPARTGSAGPTPAAAGGDFSRVDSYENFERAEDERSLSLPICNVVPKDDVIVNAEVRGEGGGAAPFGVQQQQQPLRHPSPRIRSKSQTNHHQHLQQQQQKEEQQNQAVSATQPAVTTDGADSGIGSDSPKAQPQPLNPIEKMAEGTSTSDKFATANRKMPPPPVPPKSRRNSSMDLDDFEPDDPMRSAYEDSTIGRDHSVLPPGARPALSRRHSAQGADGTPGGSSGDEKATAPETTTTTTTKKVCPMVQPELVAMGRYDPNSRCFSYVPVKALKEHYSAPKKPAPVLKRRISVVDDLDSPASPTEAQLALQNLGQKGSNGDVRRRAETPKWETEIDKVTGRVEPLPERRPRRASASFTPVGQLQPDEVRSPSAQVRSPHEEWRLRQRHQQQRRTEPLEAALNECYERRFIAGREESRPETREGTRTSVAHTVPRAQTPREALAHAERPLVVDQAKRATPVPAHHSAHVGHQPPLGLRLSSSVPAPSKLSPRSNGRQEMDTLCDPNFYLSYSTPKAAEKGPKKKAAQAQPPYGDLLSKSMPPNDTFRPTKNELMRDDVRDLLKHHQLVTSPHRSQTPQTLDIGRNRRFGAAPSIQQDEFRRRNCRSVNSTPLIGSRKLFLHDTEDSFGSDSDDRRGAEDWLNAKLRAVKGKRYMPEAEEQWKNAERLLLEELKQKSTGAHEPRGGGDPLEEYRREEQRLKNTHSPLVMDNPLRMANKNLQKERARHFLLNQPLQTIEPFRTFPSPQRSPPPFGNLPLSITTASSPQNENFLQKDQSRPFHQQPNRNVESPILQPIRRGATPTSQIVRGKPPTPPPLLSREDRARSKSPYALKFLRGNSSSAPPATAAAKKGQQNQTQERRESNPMVNPQLYALRQSLYAKERQRIGDGRETDEAFADREQFAVAGREEPLFTSGQNPSSSSACSSTFVQNSSPHRLHHPPNTPSNATEHRTPAVKPILKRSTTGSNNGVEQHEYKQYSNDQLGTEVGAWLNTGGGGGVKTLDEESHAVVGRAHQTSDFTERSDTPQFPVSERTETPMPYHPLLYRRDSPTEDAIMLRQSHSGKSQTTTTGSSNRINSNNIYSNHTNNRIGAITPHGMYGNGTPVGFNRRSSLTSFDGAEVIHHHPVFVKDTSRYWYKPTISREEAIAMLKSKPPGTFIVRDSNSFPGAFGLALKVTQPPAGVPSSGDGNELVRHFLIEPSPKGVRLKGCSNEPVFGTLAALVYQHSITPLALPCRLILPEFDPAATPEHLNSNQALLERGAACNVTYLCSVDTESLTGPEALRRSTSHCFELLQRRELRAVSVHFKVSSQGITLTDNTRSMFFRRHYPGNKVTFAGIDPESRVFDNNNVSQLPPTYVRQAPIFGFVARKSEVADHSGSVENACHLFAELDPDQPASAVVRFITNVMMPVGRAQLHQIHQNVNAR